MSLPVNMREMERVCLDCSGRGYVGSILPACVKCKGTGREAIRCSHCVTWKPIAEFTRASSRVAARVAKQCHVCRHRYDGTKGRPRAGINDTGPLLVKLALKSGNRKTGPIPVSMTSAGTCPKSCPFLNAGCYAEQHLIAMHWRRLSNGAGMEWNTFVEHVRAFPEGQIWRHNEAGDLPGDDEEISWEHMIPLVHANFGKRGFTYTHKSPTYEHNEAIIAWAVQQGFSINLSANSLDEADKLASLAIAPVVVVLPHDSTARATKTPGGRTIVVCPAQVHEQVSCASCKLCAVPKRKSIVGFLAHGDRKHQMSSTMRQLPLLK